MKRIQVNCWIICLGWLISCSPGVEDLIQRGKQELNKGAHEQAIETFSEAIEKDTSHAEAFNGRAVGYYELEKYGLAIDDLTQAIRLDSASYKPYYNRANARREIENFEAALQDYTQAINLKPNVKDIYINRGVVLYQTGNYSQALQDFGFAVKLDSTDVLAQFNLAKTALVLEKEEEARIAFNKVLQLQPDYGEAYYWLGFIAVQQKKKEEACLLLQKALNSGFEQAKSTIEENC